ncbi:hypothetical protein [Gordonia sp. NPDC058843]|uniref:hypothetical protein n=1 Tax=Gordonia sp. NPDC058843 TaxID=3346648 RepID=UPI003693A121
MPKSHARPATLSVPQTIRRFVPLLSGLRWRLVVAITFYLVQVNATVVTGGVTESVLLRLRDQLYAHTQRLAPHARNRFGDGDLLSRNTATSRPSTACCRREWFPGPSPW